MFATSLPTFSGVEKFHGIFLFMAAFSFVGYYATVLYCIIDGILILTDAPNYHSSILGNTSSAFGICLIFASEKLACVGGAGGGAVLGVLLYLGCAGCCDLDNENDEDNTEWSFNFQLASSWSKSSVKTIESITLFENGLFSLIPPFAKIVAGVIQFYSIIDGLIIVADEPTYHSAILGDTSLVVGICMIYFSPAAEFVGYLVGIILGVALAIPLYCIRIICS